jgi:hypothetical protein
VGGRGGWPGIDGDRHGFGVLWDEYLTRVGAGELPGGRSAACPGLWVRRGVAGRTHLGAVSGLLEFTYLAFFSQEESES